MASTLGTSAGPFAALPLSSVQPFVWRGFEVSPVTCVGWLFAGLWLAAALATLVLFKDPGGRAAR